MLVHQVLDQLTNAARKQLIRVKSLQMSYFRIYPGHPTLLGISGADELSDHYPKPAKYARTRTTSYTTTSARLGTTRGTDFLGGSLFTVNWCVSFSGHVSGMLD